ncbi:MAG: ArsA family ATPase [Acidimicrobiales bacterium]
MTSSDPRPRSAPRPPAEVVDELVAGHRVLICAGSGGVGKTTVAAALALQAARAGRRACVVTIDPARRLADALGVGELTNDPGLVAGDWAGELWALMLDTKATFDQVVSDQAENQAQAEAIYANRFYRNISVALSGTQEYMAMEKLHQLHAGGRFDLVVVDTPPTRRALDFLDAPGRLTRLLDNRIFRLIMRPTRVGLRALNLATQLFLRTVSRVVGSDVVSDAVGFFEAFEGMEQGFRDRAQDVATLLAEPTTGWVLVTAPRQEAIDEAIYFAERLHQSSVSIDALVVNRIHPRFRPAPDLGEGGPPPGPLADLVTNLAQLDALARREEVYVGSVEGRVPEATVLRVPQLDGEVHDLAALAAVGDLLRAGPGPRW